jgi:hypothetical protein
MNSPELKINPNGTSDLTINDIIFFIKFNWKLILISCLLGIILSIISIFNVPKLYSGKQTIVLGKVTNPSIYPSGLPIEDIGLLIFKSKNQAKFIDECRYESNDSISSYLNLGSIQIKTSKDIPNAIDISTKQKTQIQVHNCLNELSNLIAKNYSDSTILFIRNYEIIIENQNKLIKKYEDTIKLFNIDRLNIGANLFIYTSLVSDLKKSENILLESTKIRNYFLNNQPYIIGEVEISSKLVNSYLIRIIFGFLMGLIAGTSFILFKAYLRKS